MTMLLGATLALTAFAGCQSAGAQGVENGGQSPAAEAAADTQSAEAPATDIQSGEGEKLRVVTTTFPPYDFVRQIAGDRVELTMLLSPGAESHSFEPTPQDIITIQNCDVFLYAGGTGDAWVDRILESIDKPDMRVMPMLDMVEPVTEETVEGMEADDHDHDGDEDHGEEDHEHEDEAGDHDHDDHGEYDEHVWTSPKNARIIVDAIAGLLAEADPAGAEGYSANAAAYGEKLAALDADFRDAVSAATHKTLVFGDRFPFRYLVDEYGLTYYAAFAGCATETEASAATVAFLIDKVKEEELPAVMHIELSGEKMADTIAESTGAEKLLLHSCHNVTRDDFEAGATYLSLMQANVETLKKALA